MSGASERRGIGVGAQDPLQRDALKTHTPTPILNLIDGRTHYDVTRDGQHFLLRQPAGAKPPAITVMVNWTEKLKK